METKFESQGPPFLFGNVGSYISLLSVCLSGDGVELLEEGGGRGVDVDLFVQELLVCFLFHGQFQILFSNIFVPVSQLPSLFSFQHHSG